MKLKTKLRLTQVGGILTTFAPLALTVGINHEQFFATKEAGVGLTMGGILAAVIVVLNLAGKGKKIFGNGFFVTGIVFGMCLLLEPVILNLKLLTGMMFLGEAGNYALFAPTVSELKRKLNFMEQANALREGLNGATT